MRETKGTGGLVDADNDGLDDRLVDSTVTNEVGILAILHRLDRMQLHELEQETLEKMFKDLKDRQDVLLEVAKDLERSVHKQISEGQYNTLRMMRKKIRVLNKKYQEIEEEKEKLTGIIQEVKLKNSIEAHIGEKWWGLISKFTFIVIIFVLLLLMYDFSTDRHPSHLLSPWNIFYIDSVCCIYLLWEFFYRLSHADDKRWFWKKNWIDFVSSIPIPPADPTRFVRLGRASRILRFLRLLRILRLFRAMYFFWRGMEKINDLFDVKMMKKSIRWAMFVIFAGALVILKVEEPPTNATHDLDSFAWSLWWSFTTVVTGGFADIYNPTTWVGQVITAILVLSGMILIGVFTATLTSLYVGEDTDELEELSENIDTKISDLQKQIDIRFEEQAKKIEKLQGNN